MTSDAATPADLPDWLLMFVEGDGDEPGHAYHRRLAYVHPPRWNSGVRGWNSGVEFRCQVSNSGVRVSFRGDLMFSGEFRGNSGLRASFRVADDHDGAVDGRCRGDGK